ncbi:hypothetical protein HMPREF9069_01178, partial [Atopobium sp. oral taxon 810 str. F0209]
MYTVPGVSTISTWEFFAGYKRVACQKSRILSNDTALLAKSHTSFQQS